MKNYILLLLLATFGMQAQTLQNPTYGNVKLKNNTTDNSSTKVNVQSTDGTINTISKSDLVNVVEINDVPSLPLVGEVGKIYVVKNVNKIYRWNGTFYQELAGTGITYQSVIDALTFTPENVSKKSDSYSVSSTVTYPSTKALVDGLETKISGATLITNRIPKSFGTNSIGNSSINDNGTTVNTNLPIHANSFVKSIGSTNLLLASGGDITQESLPISTATQTALGLKSNLASPALTGTPTAPTATAGTNTTQIATTAFVMGANAENVKLTGNQTINGQKTFSGQIVTRGIFNTYSNTSPFTSSTTDDIISRNSSIGTGSATIEFNAGGYTNGTYRMGVDGTDRVFKIGDNDNVYFKYQKSNGALTLESTGGVTAPKFIKSSAPTTNILLAGGGDIAQNTAFNKNFGTTAGTVADGAYSPSKTGVGASGVWDIGIQKEYILPGGFTPVYEDLISYGTSDYRSKIQGFNEFSISSGTGLRFLTRGVDNLDKSALTLKYDGGAIVHSLSGTGDGNVVADGDGTLKRGVALGSNAYNSTAYLPLTGGTVNGLVYLNSTDGGSLSFQTNSLPLALMTSSKNIIGGAGSTTDFNTYVYGNNPYNIWTNGVKRVTVSGDGDAIFTNTVTASPATASNHLVTKAQLDASATSRPYKVYTALVSQTGTNAPTAVVLENTLGGSVVWTRTSTGSYLGTLTGVFTANKTFCTTTIGAYLSGGSNSIGLVRNSVDDVFLFTNRGIAGTDAILNNASIEIRVYPSLE